MTRDVTHLPLDNSGEADQDMVTCVNGHANPGEWDTCGECGEPLDETEGFLEWCRRPRHLAMIVVAVAVVVGLIVVAALVSRSDRTVSSADAQRAAVQQWWSSARPDVDELEDSLDEVERAIRRWDSSAFKDGCQRMHDAAAVGVPARLPAPDPQINAELSAAADDAHSASHMCLSAIAQTRNDYDGEFTAATEQAAMHVKSAKALIDLDVTA